MSTPKVSQFELQQAALACPPGSTLSVEEFASRTGVSTTDTGDDAALTVEP